MFVDGTYVREIGSAGVERRAYHGQKGGGVYDGDTAIDYDESLSARASASNEGISWHEFSVQDQSEEPVDILVAYEESGSEIAAQYGELSHPDGSSKQDELTLEQNNELPEAQQSENEVVGVSSLAGLAAPALERPATFGFEEIQEEAEVESIRMRLKADPFFGIYKLDSTRGKEGRSSEGIRRHRPKSD